MLVRCRHYSVTYPTSTGMQKEGDIFNLTKEQAEYYARIGWVEILPQDEQPKVRRGRKKIESIVSDLSKSKQVGRYLEHIYKGGN